MRLPLSIIFFLLTISSAFAQDIIEREYFSGARAKNSAIAAARYSEEAYYYARFTTFVYVVDSSRSFADTSLFFIKRADMLSDTIFKYVDYSNPDVIELLENADENLHIADSVVRDFYPMSDIKSHHYFGKMACMYLSESTMDYYNASLYMDAGDSVPEEEQNRYQVLAYKDEVERLELDEAAFQLAANEMDGRMNNLSEIIIRLETEIKNASDQKAEKNLRDQKKLFSAELTHVKKNLEESSQQLESIKELLDKRFLEEVEGIEFVEKMSQFETAKSNYSENDILIDEEIPDGLVYKIQLGYYPKDENIENFYGLFPITGETVGDDLVRIYAGLFYNYESASKGKKYIREKLIPNAFVVPYYNGEKISNSRAVEIEKQRAAK